MGRPVAFFEILSTDTQRAQRFYGDLFDWKVEPDEAMGGYAMVDTGAGEGAIGGGMGAPDAPDQAGIRIYIGVDDLDGYLGRAEALGGRTLVPPTDLPEGYGRMAVFADPDGNPVGLWA